MPKQTSVKGDIQQLHQVFSDLVIIDPAVKDYQSLATSVNPGAEAIILHSRRDGISQIAEILAARPHVQTLHLVSHGGPGSLQLGNSQLNQDNLQQIQTWRQPSLSNILIYGCQVAAGESGQRFVEQFSHLTGAAVAASSTKTGAANLGGNWELEFRIGDIWAALAFPTQFRSAYAGVFATITVSTLLDEDDGSLVGGAGISLREAINYSATGDTIQLAAGTYTLTLDGSAEDLGLTGDLDIDGKNLIIIGAGQATTTIDASGFTAGNEDRVFHLLNNASLDISALTITGGYIDDTDGGGIRIESGDLTITNVTVSGNMADDGVGGGEGGGIYVESGTVTITDSEISGNTAAEDGGGIYVYDSTANVTIINTLFTGNNAKYGGGVYVQDGNVTITGSTFTGNTVSTNGGGVYVYYGNVTITGSDISGNTAGDDGGGVYIYDDAAVVTISNTTITGNQADTSGGGIYLESGTLTITDSEISGNNADSYGGGIYAYDDAADLTINNTDITGNTATYGGGLYIEDGPTVEINNSAISLNEATSGYGGGIYIYDGSAVVTINSSTISDNTSSSYGGGILNYGTLSVNDSTISGNTSADYGGGIYNTGTLEVTNTTISGNEATADYGGGIYNYDTGDATIVNSTISGNTAAYGGGIYNSATMSITNSTIYGNTASANDGGGIYNSSTLDINNTIVIGNTAAGAGPDVYDSGTITSNGFNIIGDTTDATFFDTSGDITGVTAAAVIDTTLALNDAPAGSPLTHALIPGGPAMDAGNDADAAGLTTDQRGFVRIGGGAVDIGAVEFVPTISIAAQTPTAAEGGATGVYRITRDFATPAPQTVALTLDTGTSTAIASDYTLSGGSVSGTAPNFTVVIPANAAFVDVTLTATDDILPELAETVKLDIATASDYIVDTTNPNATVTISANDPITYGVALTSPTSPANEGDSGATTLLFNVTRSGGIGTDSTVNYAIGGTVNATDYNNIRVNGTTGTATGTLSFAAGESSKLVSVDVLGDGVVEPNETLSLTLSAPNKTTAPESSTIATATASFTATNDDTAGVTVNPTSISTTEAGGTAAFTVVLDSEPTANVTVALSGVDATEGTLSASSLTFTAANWDTPQTVTVTGVDDDIADGAVSYTITTAATSTDTAYSGIAVDDVTVSNSDDETPGITVNPTSGITTETAGGNATFTVVLNTEPTANVTIPISSSDTTEGTVDKSSLTFTATNWDVPKL
ncbi:MAG: hypothetical protein Fur0025_04680 [Oscillatoriaceae cyanobacterium]